MPLPDNYYDLINRTKDEDKKEDTYSPYKDLGMSEPVRDKGSAYDALGTAAWGYLSGMTWGMSEAFGLGPDETWEEMSDSERAAWVLGEGAALFTPGLGPFAAMGKISQKVARIGANKVIGKAAQDAGDLAITKVDDVATSLLRTGKTTKDLSKGVQAGLKKASDDKISIEWMKNLNATGTAVTKAATNLQLSSRNAIRKAFDDVGFKDIADDAVDEISHAYVKSLKKGRYVNDTAEWVEAALKGTGIPLIARDTASKYLGMVAQDLAMMNVHGLFVGKMKSIASGEDYDWQGIMKHSGIMALGFPLIRSGFGIAPLQAGGLDKASNGIKMWFN